MPNAREIHPITEFCGCEFQIARIFVKKLKLKPGGIPCFPKKMDFVKPEKVQSLADLRSQYQVLTNIDFSNVEKNYDIDYEFCTGWGFPVNIYKPFYRFINHYYQIKRDNKKSHPEKSYLAKITLNSCYGKFGQKRKVLATFPEIRKGKVSHHVIGWQRMGQEGNIVIATYITAMSRNLLFQLIYKINKSPKYNFIYCDTDSAHLQARNPLKKHYFERDLGIKIGKNIGELKIEHYFEEAKYFREKCYFGLNEDETWDLRCAGVDDIGKKELEQKLFTDDLSNIKLPINLSTKSLRRINGGFKKERTEIELGRESQEPKRLH